MPTSYIKTLGVTVARPADSFSWAYTPTPQGIAGYVRFEERGTATSTAGRILQIGKSDDSVPRFLVLRNTNYRVQHDNGLGTRTADLAASPVYGDVVELVFLLFADGSVALYQSINGAGVTTAGPSAALVLPAAWSDAVLWLNSVGTTGAGISDFLDLRIVKIADLVASTAQGRMDELRAFTLSPATRILFTDAFGAAALDNGKVFPGDRFANWTPISAPFGEGANRQSDGAETVFRFRDDYAASFDLPAISSVRVNGVAPVDIADRLCYHLKNGGTCTIATGDAAGSYYLTCGRKPGSTPLLKMTDARSIEYTLSLEVLNLDASPTRMTCRYAEQ